jgi:ADP-heptose:LPS heptosyltransferase
MNIIFQIDGGLGKSVMGTAVLRAIRKQYPDDYIIVVTSYPDVFIGNPNANKILNQSQTSGIYKKYVMNQDSKVFVADPYNTSDYITESKHLIEIWCDMFGISYNGEKPELFISNSEKQYFGKFYKTEKPIFVIQTNGGGTGQPLQYSWTRDMPQPVVEEIINYFKDKYTILHVKREDQPVYPNTLQALDTFRSIAILLTLSEKRLLIDSSVMHIAQSLGLSSVVMWVGTNPNVFGYENNQNIVANEPTREINLEHNYYAKHLLFEDLGTIPYNDLNEMFDIDTIIQSIKNQY